MQTGDIKETDNKSTSSNEAAKKLTSADFDAFAKSINGFFANQGKDAVKELSGPLSNHTAKLDSNGGIILVPLNTQPTYEDDKKNNEKLIQDIKDMKPNDKMSPEEVYHLAGKLDALNLATEKQGKDVKKIAEKFSLWVDNQFLLPSQQKNQSKNEQVVSDDKNGDDFDDFPVTIR
jgi:hypothetical protein